MFTLLSTGLHLQRGTVVAVNECVHVEPHDTPAATIACGVLQTSSAPPPRYAPGDAVVFVAGDTGDFVLGVVSTPRSAHNPPSKSVTTPDPEPATVSVSDVDPSADEVSAVLMLRAAERVEIRCGDAALILRSDGHAILKGRQVLTRARGVHKIKGAAVQIN